MLLILFRNAAGASYTLEAEAGSFTFTGTAADVLRGRAVAADAGAYAITGATASLLYGRMVAADAGAFTLNGTDADLQLGRMVAADAGSFIVSGTAASLEYGRVLAADAGSYALTGIDATLVKATGYNIVAGAGSYDLTGTDADIAFTARALEAGAGNYELIGTDAALQIGTVVTSTPSGGGYWPNVKRPEYRIYPEYDDAKPKRKRKKKVRETEQVVLAPDPVIETGIVTVRPAWDAMVELQQQRDEAERVRLERLRAILLADDEWLMAA